MQPGISPYAIVYFGNDWFAENRTSSHHVAARLGRVTPLLYVDAPGMRAPKATGRDLKKIWRILQKAFAKPQLIGERMWHITMPQIPFRGLPAIRKLNRAFGTWRVRRALSQLGFDKRISWFAVPHPAALARRVGDRHVVYYCIDDYASFPDMNKAEITHLDEELTRTADQVFVSSSTLLERKSRLNPHVAYSPHGVDFDLFRLASDPDLPVAEPAQGLRHPVIGYFGSIGAWTDLEMIAWLAERRPAWTFLLIGMPSVDVSLLTRLNNVVLTGSQPYQSLPRWAKAFDVAIIPYLPTEQVKNASPLKVREYLATGKPVVTVPSQEINRFAGVVAIAADREQFLAKIEEALSNDSEAARQARWEAVAPMTWDARVAEAIHVTESRLAELDGKA
jgi:glycosyltransferase involved in cell wall biosynthesis